MKKYLHKGTISAGLMVFIVLIIVVGYFAVELWIKYKTKTAEPYFSLPGEDSNWQIHPNKEYGFEIKYPPTWKQCPITHYTEVGVLLVVGPSMECVGGWFGVSASVVTLTRQPLEWFVISSRPTLFNQYKDIDHLKTFFETVMSKNDLFDGSRVGNIKIVSLGDNTTLQVIEYGRYDVDGIQSVYIFHGGNLFRIRYDLTYNEKRELAPSAVATQILSTLKFTK